MNNSVIHTNRNKLKQDQIIKQNNYVSGGGVNHTKNQGITVQKSQIAGAPHGNSSQQHQYRTNAAQLVK